MKLKSLALVGALIAAVALGARKASAFLSGVVVNGTYAVSQVIPISLGSGVQNLGVIVNYSSPTFSAHTFTTGQVSTGSITIASNAALSTAAATDSIVVLSTSGLKTDYISLSYPTPPGAVVLRRSRGDWNYGANTSAAATSIAAALNANSLALGNVSFVASGNVVYATAPVGSLYNNISVNTNTPTTLGISSPTFLGGLNATDIHVNGFHFKANRDYSVGANANASATNLAAAINSVIPNLVTATASTNHVNLQSVAAGATYSLTTSNASAASVSAAYTYGAQTPSWTLGGTAINVPGHGFVTGLQVLYSTSSGAPAISGLVTGTTYYVGVVDANDVALATTAARASQGLYVTLASSSTQTAAKSYNLAPLAFSAGSAGFSWEVSNDNQTWAPLASVSSVTYSAPGSSVWSFGALPFSYLGVNFTAPAAGALTLKVNAQGQ